ncbi:hypothetical protein [Anaeroselena agilis]|uniref:Uncharacterized protein n=1 Tax=Anaeroselena agilis TaxID=3063788 RepID=A0ABU3NWK6_9FIRM|nr:hypothetical protein [Selenomonadales bacterium 4137-cl]
MSIHKVYATMTGREQAAVDEAFRAAARTLRAHGLPATGDDRAEILVEAIAVYAEESKKAGR